MKPAYLPTLNCIHMALNNFGITGLSKTEVQFARKKYGYNQQTFKKDNVFFEAVKNLVKEPMVILLLITSFIYMMSGQTNDAVILSCSVVLVVAISLYQDSRSRIALEKLKDFSRPGCRVIRDGKVNKIKTDELVVGDSLVIEEGNYISADGTIAHSNDFSVNESLLTGEALSVFKNEVQEDYFVYQGTTVSSGLAIATVTAIGNETRLGKIGKSLESISIERTPLELQIGNFVKKMVIAGVIVFIVVWGINYSRSYLIVDSLLKALTLAMSILPEEIPVAFTTFMALGAWRLMKMGIVVKQMKTVETLGSATVICTDKTGTLTENKMNLAKLFLPGSDEMITAEGKLNDQARGLIRMAMWASEPIPFDPMEIALHDAYSKNYIIDERAGYKMIHEYPLEGRPPMMTHIFEHPDHQRIVAAKGAMEAIIKGCKLTATEKTHIIKAANLLAAAGYRVLGVAEAVFNGNIFPDKQQAFNFIFKGLVAFYDPSKKNIPQVLEAFYNAGISVKIITGDHGVTTAAIAAQIGLKDYEKSISGDELLHLTADELQQKVMDTAIFTRMFPEAKLRVINALKAENQVVAMIGDGVNDGPALKAAHIGIAMGTKGTELAKQAASLVLVEDDLAMMVDAIAMGRKIYANLKKAIRYIISIHIPIILMVFIPLALGWKYPVIFLPVHIIFLELIMGPTCSVTYENEPMEKNTMLQKPRPFTLTFFSWKELLTSVVQGAAITAAALIIYVYAIDQSYNEAITRTMVFTVLIASNIILTLVNRSFYYSLITTLKYRNVLVPVIIVITISISAALIYVQPLTRFFKFQSLDSSQLMISIAAGLLAVIWYEAVKWKKRNKDGGVTAAW